MTDSSAFVHFVFHVVLLFAIHGRRTQRRRKRRKPWHEIWPRLTLQYAPAINRAAQITINERRSHETHSPLPKPVALPQELQTKPCHPDCPGEAAFRVSPGAIRFETKDHDFSGRIALRTAASTRRSWSKQNPRWRCMVNATAFD